ncbi:DNA-binding response regulator [Roseateles aquatilis]|uniref:DNA-binding response regulator n=1 Tax=Roseateles aquatilis TaxID=431061 RepID=A0A246JHU3_9BURK|nr:response regulator transcription factor [Roseateles aquatilis]OWQ92132.1 DNA-binding response regulator [Roseateles aquatilis]
MISILICDDHAVVRYGIMAVLEAQGEFRLVGAVGDGDAAIAVAAREQPQVVLMDLLMPGRNGVDTTREIKRVSPGSHVMLLTSHEGDEHLVEAMQAGAISYLLKDTPPGELVQAIERTARGEPALHPRIATAMMRALSGPAAEVAPDLLTPREAEVLGLIAEGLPNAAIAARLGLSEKTVKNHVTSILAKLQVDDRTQAAVFAWRQRLKDR